MQTSGWLLMALLTAAAAQAGEVTIRRDTWGVPHVFAATLADGAYGIGYAQAEDRLDQIFANYREAVGRMAEVHGAGLVEQDWEQRLAGHEAVSKRRYPELPAAVREMCEAYLDGVRAYMAEHPERHPVDWLEPEPWMEAALCRNIIFRWPLGQALHELDLRGEVAFFSNQWAVRPERTTDGAALLCIDPHIPWDGPFRSWEFRLHAGGHDISGFAILGAPFLSLGHNAFLGWAATTGGPDTTDIYVEQIDPADPKRYRYDDGWRPITSETVTMGVKDAPPVTRELERTHHGPIALREPGKAYAIACPYLDQVDLIAQIYGQMTSRNLAEFRAALGMNQMMEENILYADVEGHIQPVPGNASKSGWLGLHAMDDLVQVLDPPTGYLQNCNIAPDTMARGLKLDPAAFPAYIFQDTPGRSNSRGRRAVELLDSHPKLTLAQATSIALDTHADGCERWQTALREALRTLSPPEPVRRAAAVLIAWDGRMQKDSVAASLYRVLRIRAEEHELQLGDDPLPTVALQTLLGSLSEGMAWLAEGFGTWEVAYGRLHRVRRGARSWPVSGGDTGAGQTLRCVGAELDGHVFYGRTGQAWTQLVQLKPGAVRSWSVTAYGQSDDPASPHYTDQGERLMGLGRLKPTWFQPTELEGHVESTRVLRR
ncbi:MAG: penicillin acylase family protein [Armatimonadetes bacterium]|nr:penicillin acylase family protein [Armatimonadota bacterium]